MCTSCGTFALVSSLSKALNTSIGVAASAPATSIRSGAFIFETNASLLGGDVFLGRLFEMRHVFEAVVAIAHPRGAAVVINRDGVDAGFSETLRKLFVEAVQATHV